MTDSAKDVSTLVLVGDREYVLRASRSRVLFEHYSRGEASLEQTIALTLDSSHEHHPDSTSSPEDAAVPIIVSTPSTGRFELSTNDANSSPFECLLSHNSSWTYVIKFRAPEVSESDYAWDNFQDQVVVHTRLSKLVVKLEAWKHAVPPSLLPEQESSLLFPVSLPCVKAPPLRLFGAIERNAEKADPNQRHRAPSPSFTGITKHPAPLVSKDINNLDVLPKPRTPRIESLPSLSRPSSSERQPSPAITSAENVVQLPLHTVTAVQSQREAREVILKLRSRRTYQSYTKVSVGTSPTSVADTELFPETVALDASTRADLEEFNNLVVAARDQVTKETAKAKRELAYYQQLLPKPPSREFAAEMRTSMLGATTATPNPRKPQNISAAMKRLSKLPSLTRPSSGAATASSADLILSVNNQEVSVLEHATQPRRRSARQRITKLQPLSAPHKRTKLPTSPTTKRSVNQQQQPTYELDDFDDPDPEVDDAPIIPDDLSGVATLDVDEY
ncbi:hypothetical protein PHYPSEUDO_011510 [Phytophthora pseudosyringae]|uniref:Uncharacterized protein n=1 Tax=Phytophthora pseudosyringae TaxID=221518 RepID=A0A8T1V8A6_9STRA|nr:hypothetical protein PHYPSEUDO_011510 [Phytophthora pseudosyringae]